VLAQKWGGVVLAAGFVSVAAIAVLANLAKIRAGEDTQGQTTEAAALLTFASAVLLTTEHLIFGIVLGGLIAVLLHLKDAMHAFAGRLSERDVAAIMRFAVVSLIVLPLVPDATLGPFQVLNPRQIWWVVVLIVGIGLAGYVSYRLFGERAGAVLSGILGGLVSSTATTVAHARLVRERSDALGFAAVIIVIASTIAAARVIVLVAVIAPATLRAVAPPLAAFLLLMVVISVVMLRGSATSKHASPEPGNPAELKSALVFAAVYAIVTLATAAAREYLGTDALYGIAAVSGFVDVDAITLSTAKLAAVERVEPGMVWRVVLIATLTNLVFKTGIAGTIGSRKLFQHLLWPMLTALGAGLVLLWIWPA
jgi:uncharacterized membrane protein (DUF4010 family)